MYAKGMTTRQIAEQMEEIYGFECSESFISNVTDKIIAEIEEWQKRPLDEVYPIVFIDAVHFSVREDNRISITSICPCYQIVLSIFPTQFYFLS